MRNLRRRHDLKVLLLFWGAQWLLPLVSILLFQRRFSYGPMVISDHLLIVETAFGLLFGGTMARGRCVGCGRGVRRVPCCPWPGAF